MFLKCKEENRQGGIQLSVTRMGPRCGTVTTEEATGHGVAQGLYIIKSVG